MKATGIVRRIDDLGRIVIPKEIRKTLKVKEGMPLEIYTDKEGGIILRKFLPFSEMSSLSEEFAQCVAQQMGNAVFVTDREKVVAAAGYTGEDIVGEPISHILENILDDRDERLPLSERNRFIPVIHGMEEHEQICQAIRNWNWTYEFFRFGLAIRIRKSLPARKQNRVRQLISSTKTQKGIRKWNSFPDHRDMNRETAV